MGRSRINDESTMLRLPSGTLERIKAVLKDREPQAEFLRLAILRELDQREKAKTAISNTVTVDFTQEKPAKRDRVKKPKFG